MRRVRATIFVVAKQWVLNSQSVCICRLRYQARNTHAPYSHLLPAPLYNIFPHYLINGTIFGKKVLNTKCEFWFSLQLLSETFLILRITERDMIKKSYFVLRVKYPLFLSDFSKTWIFSTNFGDSIKYQISWQSVQWVPILFHVV